ncbi:type II toxin-antitoxin system VapC family toxin [Rhizobium leguminosarum]|uniref:type II toxin-antitoxin system VapC family toxin n=1 Tax=Rhizobium leguminosarum TaxID=384 RepID=UPI001441BAAC|nr:PIN domain-containing protein [Rhizobium leguminosarum]MBY5868483.1 PIN domain nuclease [Rhizobium leguminosarum]NKM07740.1 PIN domain-containing protein [Rhizobium leguminosarum bv. viciae]
MPIHSEVNYDGRRRLLLLDTTILSARAKISPPAGLRYWLEDVAEIAYLCVCFPVLIEIKRGLHMTRDPATAARVRKVIEDIEQSDFLYLALGRDTEDIFAAMLATPALKRFWYADPKAKHQRVSNDLTIAAMAITYDALIITADGDFKDIHRYFDLPGVYNPIREEWVVEPPEPIELPRLRPEAPTP